jgi:uncharacterized protein YcfJ
MKVTLDSDKNAKAQGQLTILKAVAASVILLMAAAGCAGQGLGKQTVVVKHYPQCYEPITTLRQEAKEMNANVAKGAVGGAVAGALAGALTGKKENILIGAAAGAVVGATVGYIATSELQAKDRATRFATYQKYMDDDYSQLDKAVSSSRVAINCYSDAYKKLTSDYKAGAMPKEEMHERVREIRDGTADAREILVYFRDASANNLQVYADVQRDERARPADKGSASQFGAYNRSVAKNKAKVDEASLQVKEAETVIAAAEDILKVVNLKLKTMFASFKAAAPPTQNPVS